MSSRVLLRVKSGPRVGLGHVMRTRAVAEQLVSLGATPLFVVDDEPTAEFLRGAGFEARAAFAHPAWLHEPAAGAWLDGFVDWSSELRALARRGTPGFVVENRTPCREWASAVVYPALHHVPDRWDEIHAERVLAGAPWIPLSSAVRAQASVARDLDVLVTFGGTDPLASSERVLAALPAGLRVAVSVGAHMEPRRAELARAAAHLAAELLPCQGALAPWMARARVAVTALGTTLYELAWLRTPAVILANHEADRPVLDFYRARGPFQVLGLARELDEGALAARLPEALAAARAPATALDGRGAERLALRLLGRVAETVAA